MQIELRTFHLKVLSSLFTNIGAGFILLTLGARDLRVLTGEIFFAILCITIAFKLQRALEEYYDKF